MLKKLLSLIFLFILTGCSQKSLNQQIDLKRAQSIAATNYPDCEISSITYNESDTAPSYSLRLIDDTTDYEIAISAIDGSITEYSRIPLPTSVTPKINLADAKSMALTLHPGEIIECDLDTSGELPYYEITIDDGTYEYDIEINALTGDIVEVGHDISIH